MRRYLLLMLVVCLVGSLVGARGLEVWLTGHSNEEMRIIEEITEEFTARTGITVDFTNLSWSDFEHRFLMAAASGEAPDVGGMGLLFAPELGLRGAVLDLAATFGQEFRELEARLSPAHMRSLKYRNAVFGLPYQGFSTMLYVRDDIAQDMGMATPSTWSEVRQIIPRLQANNMNFNLPNGINTGIYAEAGSFIWQHGGDDYTPDLNASGYSLPESINGFKEWAELYTLYGIARETPFFQAFTSGDHPFLMGNMQLYTSFQMSAPQIQGKWSVAVSPGTPRGGEIYHTQFLGGSAISIFRNSRRQAEAWEFVKWYLSDATQTRVTQEIMRRIQGSMFLPASSVALAQLEIREEHRSAFVKQMEHSMASIYGLVAPQHRRRYLQFAGEEAVTLGHDPREAMLKAAREHDAEIRRKQQEYDRFISRL